MALLAAFSLVVLVFVLRLYAGHKKQLNAIGDWPGERHFFNFAILAVIRSIMSLAPARFRRVRPGKHDAYAQWGWDMYSIASVFPSNKIFLRCADAAAIKAITGSRTLWPKSLRHYRILAVFGPNIVVTESDEWKRHRKVVNPAFSEPNTRLVWETTTRVVTDLIENVWKDNDEVSVDHVGDITKTIAVLVIGGAGFGRALSWDDEAKIPQGHRMSFRNALETTATDIFLKVLVPDWVPSVTKRLRKFRTAMSEMERYMYEMIESRRKQEKTQQVNDLFNLLLDGTEGEVEDKLSDSELFGNIFIFLVAGHETTAHALAFSFALLALHQDEQKKLYQHIEAVLGDTRVPNFDQMNQLTLPLAVLYESLRMFSPANAVIKQCTQDTTLVIGNSREEKRIATLPAGTIVAPDIVGVHYNPRYWKDPYEFRPERFTGDWPRDAFLPFSAGSRSCIGRRFTEAESVAVLSMIIRKYKVEIREDPAFASETFEEKKARILKTRQMLTVAPASVPVRFRRRAGGLN